jgi:hypothetical protein
MMAPFIYRCPRTGLRVRDFGPLPGHLTDGEIYEPMTCTACGRIHLVNLNSGKVLESPEKQK